MALIDKASLLMVPSTYEAGKLYNVLPSGNRAPDSTDQNSGYDQTRADFTFDRGTDHGATRIGSDGLIKKYRENKLLQSNNFGTTWAKSNATIASGQSGYDSTSDAWLFTTSVAGASLEQSITAAGVVVFSLYAKANSVNGVRLRIDAATDANGYFNLSTGAVHSFTGSAIDASITAIGEGWYRCEVAANISSPVKVAIYTTDGTTSYDNGSILIQDAQAETSMVATDYLDSGATTGKAGVLIDLPRINYDANGENGSLLLEPSRANLVQFSEYFGASYWTKSGSSVVSGFTSPEGLGNAYKLVEGTNNGSHQIYSSFFSGSAGNNYTTSFFVKAGERTWCRIMNYGGAVVFFDLANGVKGTESNATGSIEPLANGWYKISSTYSSQSNERAYLHIAESNNTTSYQGNGSSGIYVFGAQAELGSYSSSYIPNHGESGGVTRAADSCSVTGVSDVIGQTEGTLFFDVNISRVVGNEAIGTINSGGYANHVTIQRIGNTIQFVRNSATQSGATIVTSATISAGRYKLAIAYKSGDTACFLNGTQVSTTQTQTFTNASLSVVRMSGDAIGAIPISDSVKQATLFKERLTNSELATLTTL